METENNITGISENLADSIADQNVADESEIEKGLLYGKQIAISVSESEELEFLGLSEQHIKDISIELARYLIANGATLLYGGDLRKDGFTELFSDLSFQYKYLKDRKPSFVNYFPFPTSRKLTIEDRVNFKKKRVEIRILEIPKTINEVNTEKSFDPLRSIEDRYIVAECLTDMRIKMANESDARIVLGGKQKDFFGYLPGIFEEAYHSLKASKALYLLGGFGGAAKSIISLIKGDSPKELSDDFQFDTDFLRGFKALSKDKASIPLDYEELSSFFQRCSVESLSKKNGLSANENQILFESTNIHELVFLIIKGLKNSTDVGK